MGGDNYLNTHFNIDELKGRKRIFTNYREITSANVIEVLQGAMSLHEENKSHIQYLLDYEKGIQPLKREKKVRSDIDIKVCDNVANQVTEFKLGYNWGNPITYIQRGNKDIAENNPDSDDNGISTLNELNDLEAVYAKDQELARFVEITGIGYQFIDVNVDKNDDRMFELQTLNPLYTFCIYNNGLGCKKVAGVTYSEDSLGNKYFTVFTPKRRFEIKNEVQIINGKEKGNEWNNAQGSGELNPLGKIPIVEFIRGYDRMGCFERQISDMDALNIEVSDFANNVSQDVQNLWWGNDFEFPKDENGKTKKPVAGQWIMTNTVSNGSKPSIQALQSQFDYAGVQANIESKRNLILQKCYVPLQSDPGGGSTASAMSMSSGWSAAEASACKEEQIIRRAKMEVVELELLAISKSGKTKPNDPVLKLKVSDIQPKFTRNKTFDLATKSNSFVTLINAGVDGRVAMQTVDLFADVAQAWNDSKDMIKKYQESLISKENSSNSNKDGVQKIQSDESDQIENSPIIDGMNMKDNRKTNLDK